MSKSITMDFGKDFDYSIKPKRQIGGNHYEKKKIQPIDYIEANSLNFCEGNIIKYVTRYRDKNGLEDLKKAEWYLNRLIATLENK